MSIHIVCITVGTMRLLWICVLLSCWHLISVQAQAVFTCDSLMPQWCRVQAEEGYLTVSGCHNALRDETCNACAYCDGDVDVGSLHHRSTIAACSTRSTLL